MPTTVKIAHGRNAGDNVDINNRGPIIDDILYTYSDYGSGELETMRGRIDHLERVLRAVLAGCSIKDFRHTCQHFGLTVNTNRKDS